MDLNVCKLYTERIPKSRKDILVFHAYEYNTMVPCEGTKHPLLTPKIAQTIIIQHKIGHKWP